MARAILLSMARVKHWPDDPPCPYCGEHQRYDEATPSKPLVSAPYQTYEHGHSRTRRDTYWHTHCRACGRRIIWSVQLSPQQGKMSWSTPIDETA